ncbi:MAG: family 10 glycosylhydrolase [Verrucomicrobia bacterium]|nr:family 10 glycosylhydrolase [Verrucomicrobiota bacterium]
MPRVLPWKKAWLSVVLWLSVVMISPAAYLPSALLPPAPAREFRGVWVASVSNIDWPSKPGLSTDGQKRELRALLDRAAQLKLNAVILQIRPAGDALYASPFEPWSEFLTGQMGRAPSPFYDPLTFAVAEAHARGLELHAWLNPYRARTAGARSPAAASHISKTQPSLVRKYGRHLWLDPGDQRVEDYCVKVFLDVARRYDIDGLHMDDHFYPYREKDTDGKFLEFPDDTTFRFYQRAGGKLNRDDWRRENVNRLVKRLYTALKAEKPWVKFGVSPFGIWRPGFPKDIKGMDTFAETYSDSRLWLAKGWLDYFAPQLYWSIDAKAQSFTTLLNWWAAQNTTGRHLWPGCNTIESGGKWEAKEILNQISVTRQPRGAGGVIHYSAKALMQNRGGIADALAKGPYAPPALIPASPWLDAKPPAKPALQAEGKGGDVKLAWRAGGAEKVSWWVVQTRFNGRWTTDIFPGAQTSGALNQKFSAAPPEVIAVTAVDRCGNASAPVVVEWRSGK